METLVHQLRPDSKGRITLGKLAQGISSFRAHRLENGNILLEPFTEIPARDAWLLKNVAAAVKEELTQVAEGKSQE